MNVKFKIRRQLYTKYKPAVKNPLTDLLGLEGKKSMVYL